MGYETYGFPGGVDPPSAKTTREEKIRGILREFAQEVGYSAVVPHQFTPERRRGEIATLMRKLTKLRLLHNQLKKLKS